MAKIDVHVASAQKHKMSEGYARKNKKVYSQYASSRFKAAPRWISAEFAQRLQKSKAKVKNIKPSSLIRSGILAMTTSQSF